MEGKSEKGSSDQKHSGAHPKHSKPIDKKGLPTFKNTVPGYDHACGTPGWVSGPAKRAAAKAK